MTAPGPLRILLAEDEPVNRMAALALLRRAGHAVVAVEDGPAAVAAATDGGGFDLVLMDLGLPGFDGDEAVRRIRAQPTAPAPRVLMLTASATPGGLERCRSCGADGVLTKPLRLDALDAALAGGGFGALGDGLPETGPDAFDDAVIAQMRDFLSAARVAELIGKTAAALRQYRTALDAAWAAGDRDAVGMMAHKMAGVAGQYGCAALRRAAQALEAAVEREGLKGSASALDRLGAVHEAALAYLDARSA